MSNITKQGFKKEGSWYKGNLHCHTTNSDGCLTPKEVAELYRDNGYQFLCISDHELFADYREELDQPDFITLPGAECSVNLVAPGEMPLEYGGEGPLMTRAAWLKEREGMKALLKTHHIHGILGTRSMAEAASGNIYGKRKELPVAVYENSWKGLEAAQRQVDELRAGGCLVMYNHPLWSKVRTEEFLNLKGLWAIEIYNHSTVLDSGLGLDTRDWDSILETGHQIYAVASDDNHNTPPIPDSCGGWIMVKAAALTHEELVGSLLSGDFYSSNGPQIVDWGIRDGIAYVDCSPAERVSFICGGAVNAGIAVLKGQYGCRTERERVEKREFMTHAEYKLNGTERYIRVECTDAEGKTAWSNAIMLQRGSDAHDSN